MYVFGKKLEPPEQRGVTDRAFLASCPGAIASLFGYWEDKRGDRPMPRRADIDPLDFPTHLSGLLLVDVEGEDAGGVGIYRYRVVGTAEVELRGRDPTGLLVRDGFFGPNLDDVLGCYELVRRRRTFLYDPLGYWTPEGRWVDEYTLFLPLTKDGETVGQILVYSESRMD
jgi:hypothetical protein